MERVRERPKNKKKKISSDDTKAKNVISELEEMVTDLSRTTSEKVQSEQGLDQEQATTTSTSEVVKKPTEIETLPQVSQAPKVETTRRIVDERTKKILPPWMSKAWRWITPEDSEILEEWLKEWGDLVLSYAEVHELHLLKSRSLMASLPFKNPLVKRQLSLVQIHSIGDDLQRRQLAKWWDERKNRLRVYWLPLDEIADLIHDWALEGGRDVCTLFDLRNSGESWSSVPPKELRELMELLIKSKRANWADNEKTAIEFIY